MRSLLIAALALSALLVAGPALADGLMSMSDPSVGTTGPQSAEGPLTLTCTACSPALSITGVASGAGAIAIPAGARLHLAGGTGNAYLSGDGASDTVSFGGAAEFGGSINAFQAIQNTSGVNGGSVAVADPVRWLSTTTALLESSTADTGGTDTAFVLNSLVDLAGTDKLLSVQRVGSEKMMVTGDGNVYGSGLFVHQVAARAPTVPLIVRGTMSDSADAVGVRIGNTNTLTAAGSKVVSFCAGNPSTCASEVASIGYDGALQTTGIVAGVGLQAKAGAEPTCDESARGLIWTVAGGTGVADTVKVCAKDAADAFAWRTIY